MLENLGQKNTNKMENKVSKTEANEATKPTLTTKQETKTLETE